MTDPAQLPPRGRPLPSPRHLPPRRYSCFSKTPAELASIRTDLRKRYDGGESIRSLAGPTRAGEMRGKAIWEITGKGVNVDSVFEHPGEATFPVSCFIVKRGGMVVFCAGTTGYNLTMDARFVWMRQKRIQGSHFANLMQASQANNLVVERRIDPCMSEVFAWRDIPRAHTKMMKNQHRPGNMAVLVQAKRPGLRTLEDAAAAD